MAGYDIPREICPLEKRISDFSVSCGYDPMTVFNDFLMFVIHGFSPGAPPLKNWKYKRRQNIAFMEMTAEWVYLPKGRYRINKLVAPHNQHVICLSAQFEIP